MKLTFGPALMFALTSSTALNAATVLSADQAPIIFGALEKVQDMSMSPDGKAVFYVSRGKGPQTIGVVAPLDSPEAPKGIISDSGPSGRILGCGWASNDRLICRQYGVADSAIGILSVVRLYALDRDGKNVKALARPMTGKSLYSSEYDGEVLDWMSGDRPEVLMMRDNVAEMSTGTRMAQDIGGYSVERIDVRSLRSTRVEQPRPNVGGYLSDGLGNVRLMLSLPNQDGFLTGDLQWSYRKTGSRDWSSFSRYNTLSRAGLRPIAVDPGINAAYALETKDGRDGLYRVSLDGSLTKTLVYADPRVDIDDVIAVGRKGRIIGASYATDKRQAEYFDPAYRKIAADLSKALPGAPLVRFAGASADESSLLIYAGSDVDPGTYYVLDRGKGQLSPLEAVRPELAAVALAKVQAIAYPAADGTMVPGYLTLPPAEVGAPVGAIVMPHGGPASRDEWGFDWLAQFFAHRGYAVLQPNFRGSSGFGEKWFVDNGFKSWKIAIGDIDAAGRYLVDRKIVPADRLAIVGWSYGGYAALQAAATEPGLFHAAVAIAPVTDLAMLKQESDRFTNSTIVSRYIGSGPHIAEGSPLRRASSIKAPVLMFHGDKDLNVSVSESRAMQSALAAAGKKSELVEYPGLDHQLADSTVRAAMLKRADAFLRASLGIK